MRAGRPGILPGPGRSLRTRVAHSLLWDSCAHRFSCRKRQIHKIFCAESDSSSIYREHMLFCARPQVSHWQKG